MLIKRGNKIKKFHEKNATWNQSLNFHMMQLFFLLYVLSVFKNVAFV